MKEMSPLLASNLEILDKTQPLLAARLREHIDALSDLRQPVFQETPAGRWVTGLTEVPFFEPEQEVKKLSRSPIYIFVGIGCPPYLFRYMRALPRDVLGVIVLEPSLDLLLYTLANTSVYRAIPDGCRISFIVAEERTLSDEALEHNILRMGIFPMQNAETIIHSGLAENRKDDLLCEFFKKELLYRLNMLGNSPEDTLLGIRHGILNTVPILRSPSLQTVKEHYKGKPFVCVAAGPSLEKNVDQLVGLEDRFVIVACDTVLLPLLRRGIKPHVVTTIERPFVNYEAFVPLVLAEFGDECRDILLLSQSVSHPLIAGRWPGPCVVVGKNESPADQWLVGGVFGKPTLLSGMSVAHMALTFSIVAEASAIALIGQDLAFSESGESHVSGAVSQSIMSADKSMERIRVPGISGGLVETHRLWLSFIQIFERIIAALDGRVRISDCTEGGALIQGANVELLRDFIERNVTLSEATVLSPSHFLKPVSLNVNDLDIVSARVKQELARLDDIDSKLDEMEDGVDRAVAAALLPQKRQEYAGHVAGMLDDCHASHPVLAFIGQSYTHMAGLSLAKNRFLETVEEVSLWEKTHRGVISGHRVNVAFLRDWIRFLDGFLTWYDAFPCENGVEEKESAFELFLEKSTNEETEENRTYHATEFLNHWDLAEGEWDPFVQWNAARVLKSQGRSFEAGRIMENAFSRLEGTELSCDTISDFLWDWADIAGSHDLCEFPKFNKAISLLDGILRFSPEKMGDVNRRKKKIFEAQRDFYKEMSVVVPSSEESLRLRTCRNKAEEALMNKDLPSALTWIEELVFTDLKADRQPICGRYLQWLVETALKCRNATDGEISCSCRKILDRLWSERTIFEAIGYAWPLEFAKYLSEAGIKVHVETSDIDKRGGVARQ